MVGKIKTIYPSTYFVCDGYSNRPVSSNTDSYIEACSLGLQLPGGKIDKYSPGGGGGGKVQNIGPMGVRGGPNFSLALN